MPVTASADLPEDLARDVEAVRRLPAVPSLLRVVSETTGMRFAAVARVTDTTWTACAVHDQINFGLVPGGQLDLSTTLCTESRASRQPIVIGHASRDPHYADHHTPRIYGLESYISVPIVLPDGTYFGNLCAIDPAPVDLSSERIVTMFKLFADLIALQLDSEARHEAARSALSDARAVAELREQFIAVLGHDLRNPLAAVSATAELLARRPASLDLAAVGLRLRRTTQRMSRLIDDVLDFARGRLGGGIGLAPGVMDDLAGALHEVLNEAREAHPGRALVATIDVDAQVRGDRSRLQQLLSNLVGNAMTYGDPARPVVVEVRTAAEAWTLQVTNHGEAISPEHLRRMFEPYWRPAGHAQRSGGLGLGLYICAEIVRAHGGTLAVTSTQAHGTRFVARLPRSGA